MTGGGVMRIHRGDVVAGITVAMVLVPQSLAYATIAGVPPVHGLYAAAVSPLLAGLVGSSPYLQTGPTALTSLLVVGALAPLAPQNTAEYVVLACLLALIVGVFRLLLGLSRAGSIAYVMSQPVVAGFTLSAAVLIAASQIPAVLGTDLTETNPLTAAGEAIRRPSAWSVGGIVIAVAVVTITVGARRAHPLIPGALLASVGALVAVRLLDIDVPVVTDIPSGLPPLVLDLPWSAVPHLLLPGCVIGLVGFAEAASISRQYASTDRSRWDPNREFVGQGLANIGVGLFGGYAVGGSFSRSALNRVSGARTRWSGVVTGGAVLATLPFASVLTGLPKAALGALVIASVFALLDPRTVFRLWRYSRPQAGVATATLAVALIFAPRVQWGVVAGVVTALVLHLWRELRLDVDLWVEHDMLHVRPEGVLYFGSAPTLETRILEELAGQPRLARVELHLQRLGRVDVTGALVLRDICLDLSRADVAVTISGVPLHCGRLIHNVFAGLGLDHTHGPRNTISPAHPRFQERPSGTDTPSRARDRSPEGAAGPRARNSHEDAPVTVRRAPDRRRGDVTLPPG